MVINFIISFLYFIIMAAEDRLSKPEQEILWYYETDNNWKVFSSRFSRDFRTEISCFVPFLRKILLDKSKPQKKATKTATMTHICCRTMCLTKVSWTLRVPGYHQARQAS
jgi:hypothetical protein